jgi:two-component system, response regulator YesN
LYKILVVDDEKWIRKGIICQLESMGFDFSWIKEAADGDKALSLVSEDRPDIVITDIRMNKMDGMQLIDKVTAVYPDVKFIIISGYAEFQYAEHAVNMGVSGYLLKPIKDDHFIKTFKKVIRELDSRKEITNIKAENSILEKNNSLHKREGILNHLIHSANVIYDTAYENDLMTSDIENAGKHILVLIHIDSSNYQHSGFKYQDVDLVRFAIKNILNEIGEQYKHGSIVIVDNQKDKNQIMIVLSHKHELILKKRTDEFVLDALTKISKFLGISVTISVSGACDRISNDIYKQAREMLDLRLIYGNNNIYKYENNKIEEKFQMPEQKLKILQNCIELYDFKNAEVILKDVFSSKNLEGATSIQIRFIYSEIVNIILKVCMKLKKFDNSYINSEILSTETIDGFSNPDDIVNYILTTIIGMLKTENSILSDYKNIVIKVGKHIEQHYMDELTVKDLARKYAVNPDYLSTMYKKETGQTIIKHLNSIRIEKACLLMNTTSLSVSEIVKSVGFKDIQYFYKVFKKITGLTPAEYRKNEPV